MYKDKCILLSERTQSEHIACCIILYEILGKAVKKKKEEKKVHVQSLSGGSTILQSPQSEPCTVTPIQRAQRGKIILLQWRI